MIKWAKDENGELYVKNRQGLTEKSIDLLIEKIPSVRSGSIFCNHSGIVDQPMGGMIFWLTINRAIPIMATIRKKITARIKRCKAVKPRNGVRWTFRFCSRRCCC